MFCSHCFCFASLTILLLTGGCSSHLSSVPVDEGRFEPSVPAPAGAVILSPANTQIKYVGTALTASHEGTFTRFGGWVDNRDSLQHSRIYVEIDMKSVYTEIPLLTRHLKDSDFFDAQAFPRASFVSTDITEDSIIGNLTLHGVTRSISLPVRLRIDARTIALEGTATVRQSDFNMKSARTTSDQVPVSLLVRAARN